MADVLVNARAAGRPRLSGVERWAGELSVRLPALRPDRYAVAHPPKALSLRAGQAWEQVALPLHARRSGVQTLLNPANLAPLAFAGNVVVVHDAAALVHPEWYSTAYAGWQRRMLPAIVRRARHVITVSQFSRDEIVVATGVDPARVTVVAGGVDERFGRADDAAGRRAADAFDLRRPFVLALGGVQARKNPGVLADVARAVADRADVVLAGAHRSLQGSVRVPDGVRSVGYVPEALLPGLYAAATVVVVASLHEGFGLPALEAMAAGTPVVASDRGALAETCGEAGVLVDPSRPADVAEAVRDVLDDDALQQRLRSAGRERAAEFDWARTAQAVDATVEICCCTAVRHPETA